MLIPFVDFNGMPDPKRFRLYLQAITRDDLQAQLPLWGADPKVVQCWADDAYQFGYNEHALVIYRYVLDEFEKYPALIADNTNLIGAYYYYGKILIELRRPAEAIRPLEIVTTMNPRDAKGWEMLGHANVLTDQLDEALRCFKQALSLEGVDKWQKPEFYERVRGYIAEIEEELARRQADSSRSRMQAEMDYDTFKQELSRMGITPGTRGPKGGFMLSVPCRKPGRANPHPIEIAAIYKEGGYFNVVSLALPYFHGPKWRQITGGKPLVMQCHTWDEVLDYIMASFGERWQDSALLVDNWK